MRAAPQVVSAYDHELARRAMRATWLRPAKALSVEHRFFVAVPQSGELPGGLLREMAAHRDVSVMNWTESYKSTFHKVIAIFVSSHP